MAYKRYARRRPTYAPRRRPTIPRRTQQTRALYGQKPQTSIERYARYAGAIGSIARTVAGIAGLVNSEPKFLDNSLGGTINNVPNYAIFLNALAQGDTENNRNGNSVLDKDLNIRLHLSSTSDNPTTVGLALILVKEDADSAPSWSTVFAGANSFSPMNKDNSENYVILKRFTYSFTPGVLTQINKKFYVNLKGIHTKYDGTASTNFEKGALCLIGTSDTADTVAITGIARFNFYDN